MQVTDRIYDKNRLFNRKTLKGLDNYQEVSVLLGFSIVVLMLFLPVVAIGGFGPPDPCLDGDASGDPSNLCYCEDFKEKDIGKHGVRQPQNTFSNLYALITGSIVAAFAQQARQRKSAPSPRMRGGRFYPLLYICVVVFLGLGSMFFHATLLKWGGVMDNLSMYTFANFVLFYTLGRLVNSDLLFLISYITSVIAFAALNALELVSSFIIVLLVVLAYLGLEVYIFFWRKELRPPDRTFVYFYLPALISLGVAVLVWVMSQTGGCWCNPDGFQGHVVWHVMAGVTATLLYFYWRDSPS